MSGWLDSTVLTTLTTGLDASSLRQKVLADNVSNIDTPDFKRSDVDFEAILGSVLAENDGKLALKTTSSRHISNAADILQNAVIKDQSTTMRNDGNNVDIESEMANVAENGIYYNSVTRALSSQLGHLRTVIQSRV